MWEKVLVLILGIFVFSGLALGSSMDCRIEDQSSCTGEEIIKLTDDDNAHVGDLSTSYPKVLCCYTPGTTNSIRFENSDTHADNRFVFSTQKNENSVISSANTYSNKYYLYDNEGGDIWCQTDSSCSSGWDCVLQTDEVDDREHATACGGGFDTTVCCKLGYEINIQGQILEETDYDRVRPSENAVVEVRYEENDSLVTHNTTGSDGRYSISFLEPAGIKATVYVKKPGYIPQEIGTYHITSSDSVPSFNTTLKKGQSCQSDCTRGDSDYCDPTCVGKYDCSYDESYTTDMYGPTMDIMDICEMQKKGWIKEFNSTHNVECCAGPPHLKKGSAGNSVNIRTNVSNVESYEVKTVLRKGKLVTVHVSTWNKLEN